MRHKLLANVLLLALALNIWPCTLAAAAAIPAEGTFETAFSPDEGAEALVLKVIDAASREIEVMAYSFTSAPVVEALLRAKHRGVACTLVVDHKANVVEDRSGKSRAALSALVTAGCDVRTISTFPIAHDKVVIVDRRHVEFGSFNYSAAAAHRNSENVYVNWDAPRLSDAYLKHFSRNYKLSVPFSTRY